MKRTTKSTGAFRRATVTGSPAGMERTLSEGGPMSTPSRLGRLAAASALFLCISADPVFAGRVNLSLRQAAYTPAPVEGEPLVFGLTVNNVGTKRATEVTTLSQLPVGTVFLTADPGCKYEKPNHRIRCNYGALPPGGGSASHAFTLVPIIHGPG